MAWDSIDGLIGNASTISKDEAIKELEQILANGEDVDAGLN